MASPVLIENGIREPLYVTALKYAGVDVTRDLHAGNIDTLKINSVKSAVCDWNDTIISPQPTKVKDTLLEMKNISFSYDGERDIINDVSFSLGKGELIAIVGRNGAGKSTLSRLISGFEKESSGTISYLGEDISDLTIKERAEKIGVVMQNPNQMISKPLIYDEIALGLRLRDIDEEEIKIRVEKVLKVCGLAPFRKWPIAALSFGQRKRVTIASILVLDPEVIILDEPTAGQDFKHYTQIMEFVDEINQLGVAIILITHDMHLMLEYASRAVVISGGKKIADARPSDILTDLDVIEQANLKETSLYQLSQSVGIEDGTAFVQNFIDYEKKVRVH
nr:MULTISPECIES: DUF3744 domain-containing protein [unclassified Oceanispirochaeta]